MTDLGECADPECQQAATATWGSDAFCDPCHSARLDPIRERVAARTPFDGRARLAGLMRPGHGQGYADVRCDRCGATWVGRVLDVCGWCERSRELLVEMSAQRVLEPPDIDPDDRAHSVRMGAWAERLARAVAGGLITEQAARQALRREVAA